MVEEIVTSILEAESKAEEIKRNAAVRAKEAVAAESARAETRRKLVDDESRLELKNIARDAGKDAEKASEVYLALARERAAKVRSDAEGKLGEASELILNNLLEGI